MEDNLDHHVLADAKPPPSEEPAPQSAVHRRIYEAKEQLTEQWHELLTDSRQNLELPLPLHPPPHPLSPKHMLQGLNLARHGVYTALSQSLPRRTLLKSLVPILGAALCLYLVGKGITLPFRLLAYFLAYLPHFYGRDLALSVLARCVAIGEYVLGWAANAIPGMGLYTARYLYPAVMDQVFFSGVRACVMVVGSGVQGMKAPKSRYLIVFSRCLEDNGSAGDGVGRLTVNSGKDTASARRHPSALLRLVSYLNRTCVHLVSYTVLTMLTRLPMIGRLVWPGLAFAYMIPLLSARRAAIILAVCWIVSPPLWKSLFAYGKGIRIWWRLRSFERELVEPYWCRSQMSRIERRDWFEKNEAILCGFSLGFFILADFLSPMWIRPIIFGIAQAAASRVVVELVSDKDVDSVVASRTS
ncbi:hypothetical protein HDU85_002237 [Gaertneriomyces sp. JEL0708]|nr:hypothetical protein HDU85_002237 [Gaertneriomyces sp. JEL0708]